MYPFLMRLPTTTPFAVVLRLFLRIKAWSRAIPHPVRDIPGRCVEEKAPIPRRTTFRAVGNVIFLRGLALLYLATTLRIFSSVVLLNLIALRLLLVAVPFGFVLLPRILSDGFAGVLDSGRAISVK